MGGSLRAVFFTNLTAKIATKLKKQRKSKVGLYIYILFDLKLKYRHSNIGYRVTIF